jgi:glycosyltransferase involved in cell wall biosynthesis
MKILFYNHTGKASGAERLLLMILAWLDRSRFTPVVVCPGGESLAGMVASLELPVQTPVQTISPLEARFTVRPDHLVKYLGSFFQVIAELRTHVINIKPDLIHANSIRSGLVATAATVGLRTKVVWHLHDMLPHHPISNLIRVFALLSRRTRMIAVSAAVAENFRGRLRPLRRRLTVILNAIDLGQFHPTSVSKQQLRQELQIADATPLLGIVGQVTPRKGQLELLRAFARVLRDQPEAMLLIVGASLFNRDAEYLDLLQQTATNLGIQSRVRMLGARADVREIMQALDLLVINSSVEPFGLVAVEAMACGTPVLAAATGGLNEIIEHERDGWLVPLEDEEALANAIIHLSRQPSLRSRLAAAGQKRAATSFNAARYMKEIEEFYLTVVSNSQAARSSRSSRLADRPGITDRLQPDLLLSRTGTQHKEGSV